MDKNQSIVSIFGAGWVNKLDLSYNDDHDVVKGKVGIRVGDFEVVTFEVYEPQFYGEKENFKFKAMQTVMSEYKDSTMVDKREDATKIFIGLNSKFPQFPNATISINTFTNSNGAVVNRPKNRLSILNRIKDESKFTPEMKFKITNFVIENIQAETDVKTGDLTGRGIMQGFVIDYKEVAKPIELVLIKEGFEYALAQGWKKFDVIDIAGLVVNKGIPVKTSQGGFGKMPGESSYEYVREYVVDTAGDPKYDSFTKKEIEVALENYDKLVQELTLATGETDIEEDELPF